MKLSRSKPLSGSHCSAKPESFRVYFLFALLTNNYCYIKVNYKKKNISKLNYTSSEKKNVRSDQLIGINMYITNIYRNKA